MSSIIAKSLTAYWESVEANPGEHQLGYELSQYALRQLGQEDLALRQYRHYLQVHEDLLTDAADKTGTRWTVPVPVLARYLNSVLDGLTMTWLTDRDSEHSRDVLRLTGEHLLTLAAKPAQTAN